tara:strand:- start:21476 stop:22708 length:1233 start_codon:yes stop_codon:yes gene_type:complete
MAADGYGTPIRLWFDTGNKILGLFASSDTILPPMELMATSIALSVERKVGGMSMPFTGGMRFGMDLNMVNSAIIIEGIFTDDTLDTREVAATSARGFLDFALDHDDWAGTGKLSTVTPVSNYSDLINRTLELTDKGGTKSTISFAKANPIGVTGASANACTINLGSPVSITAVQMATHINTAVNSSMSGCAITATATTSELVPIAGSTLITLTASTTGSHSGGIAFTGTGFDPFLRPFAGGYGGSAGNPKSAGDKVQDLYGILHNTQRNSMAIVGAVVAGGVAVAATVATGGLAAPVIGAGIAGGAAATGLFNVKNDYPIGIQIPYNSMIQAPDGKMYEARNFIQQTGWGKSVQEKMSDGNENAASVDFDEGDDTSGIKGTIQKFDVGYSAGENVYTFQMSFAPIDMILA